MERRIFLAALDGSGIIMDVAGDGFGGGGAAIVDTRNIVNDGDLLIIKNPSGPYTITVNGSEAEEYYSLQVVQLPADGVIFEATQPQTILAESSSGAGTQTLKTEVAVYETSGNGNLEDVGFEIAYLKDGTGADVKDAVNPQLAVRVLDLDAEDSANELNVPAGKGKTFVTELKLPENIAEGVYTLGLTAAVKGSGLVSALNEIAPWVKNSDSYSRIMDVRVVAKATEAIPLPAGVTYSEKDGLLTVSGNIEPGAGGTLR